MKRILEKKTAFTSISQFSVNFSFKCRHAVSRRTLTVEIRVAPRPIHVGFEVNKGALGYVFLQVLQFTPT